MKTPRCDSDPIWLTFGTHLGSNPSLWAPFFLSFSDSFSSTFWDLIFMPFGLHFGSHFGPIFNHFSKMGKPWIWWRFHTFHCFYLFKTTLFLSNSGAVFGLVFWLIFLTFWLHFGSLLGSFFGPCPHMFSYFQGPIQARFWDPLFNDLGSKNGPQKLARNLIKITFLHHYWAPSLWLPFWSIWPPFWLHFDALWGSILTQFELHLGSFSIKCVITKTSKWITKGPNKSHKTT